MLCPPHSTPPIVADWLERHRHRGSLVMHLIGIPPTILAVLLSPFYLFLLSGRLFLFCLGLFVGGYLIQFLGHALEGSEPGEITFLRRKLGWSRRKWDRPLAGIAAPPESQHGVA
ncbi:MAG: DUF962 domain-containing protein [Isosphaeraceae bacterium]|nr:DUF962 domain-containing protein [Isosphaeraceae bacterium]